MQKPVQVAGLRMTTLEAQRNLSFPDYVKSILGKSDEERERLTKEREHKNAASKLESQRI